MNMKKYTATALVALTLTATNAYANTLTVDSVTGVWENAVADPVGGTISGTGTSTITWGNPSGQPQQSGYTFVGAAPPSVTFNEGEQFLLGTFTHNNFPITGTSLDTVDLQVSIGIAGHASPVETVFSFDHFETPNNANPCAGGGPNPCGDVVTTTLNTGMSETFDIDGVEYIFNVLGFSTDMGVSLFDTFLTAEGVANSAELYGTFQTKASVVPLPAAGWMLIAGLGGLAAMRRRKTAS